MSGNSRNFINLPMFLLKKFLFNNMPKVLCLPAVRLRLLAQEWVCNPFLIFIPIYKHLKRYEYLGRGCKPHPALVLFFILLTFLLSGQSLKAQSQAPKAQSNPQAQKSQSPKDQSNSKVNIEANDSSDEIADISPLMNAVIDNDVEGVKFFTRTNNTIINQKNIGGATALHLAARTGNAQIAKILIQYGARANLDDNEKWTPLMRASLAKSPEIVSMLIERGAVVEKLNSTNESAILHAVISDCIECLYILLDNINYRGANKAVLNDQFSQAYILAKDKPEIQALLSHYLNKMRIKDYGKGSKHKYSFKSALSADASKSQIFKFRKITKGKTIIYRFLGKTGKWNEFTIDMNKKYNSKKYILPTSNNLKRSFNTERKDTVNYYKFLSKKEQVSNIDNKRKKEAVPNIKNKIINSNNDPDDVIFW